MTCLPHWSLMHCFQAGDIEVLLGVSAEGVNTEEKVVELSTGDKVPYEKLFIATGGK